MNAERFRARLRNLFSPNRNAFAISRGTSTILKTSTSNTPSEAAGPRDVPGLGEIYLAFLRIGGTSFGGGVVAYLHNGLVTGKGWLDDKEFVELLGLAQILPGLNSTNLAILVGERLRGPLGAATAFLGMISVGSALILALTFVYAAHAEYPHVNGMLKGVGATAVGLLFSVAFKIGRKQLAAPFDLFIFLATLSLVSFVHLSLAVVLLAVGPAALWWHRPRPARQAEGDSR